MTINNSSNKVIIEGNGSNINFDFDFVYVAAQYIKVYYTDALGVITLLNPIEYTLTLNPISGGIWGLGGRVVYNPAAGPIDFNTSITIVRDLAETQQTSISNQGAFYPQVVEAMGDYITMLTQQLAEQQSRALLLDITSQSITPTVQSPEGLAVLGYNSDGTQIINVTPGSLNLLTSFYQDNFGNVSIGSPGSVTAGALLDVNGAIAVSIQGIFFRTDTNLGIIRSAPNTLAVKTNGGTGFSVGYFAASGTPVNYLGVLCVGAGFFPVLEAFGAGTNISVLYVSKGTGGHVFNTNGPTNNGVTQFIIAHTANAVNYIQTTGGVIGSTPTISMLGTDTNVGGTFIAKGIGSITFASNSSGNNPNFVIFSGTTPVNYAYAQGGSTGNGPQVGALGSDTDIAYNVSSKGAGVINFFTNNQSTRQFQIAHTATAVNYIVASGNATAGGPTLSAAGSDTNVDLNLFSKGTGSITLRSGSGIQVSIINTTSVVNSLTLTGAVTGSGPSIAVVGGDTNIDIVLSGKGSGLLKMGTAGMTIANGSVATVLGSLGPVGSHTTVQKWLQIKDSGGTTLFIPCF